MFKRLMLRLLEPVRVALNRLGEENMDLLEKVVRDSAKRSRDRRGEK